LCHVFAPLHCLLLLFLGDLLQSKTKNASFAG
jgi:hypothetical protein